MHLLALLGLFTPEMTNSPSFSYTATQIPTLSYWPEDWKRHLFQAECPHIGHYREYPSGSPSLPDLNLNLIYRTKLYWKTKRCQLVSLTYTCTLDFPKKLGLSLMASTCFLGGWKTACDGTCKGSTFSPACSWQKRTRSKFNFYTEIVFSQYFTKKSWSVT